MNDYNKRYLIERLGNDHRRGGGRDNADYEDDYEDERRGVKGSGRRRRRGRDRNDNEDMYDERDNYDERDRPDYHRIKLTKSQKNRWKREMENTDGTVGEHFDMQQVIAAAEKLGVRFNEYSEKDFCLVTNMIYSDYGHIIKKFVGPEKELIVCADFAKAYFDDPDGVDPEEKLAINYCMTDLE